MVFLELSAVGDPRVGGRFEPRKTGLFQELAHAYVEQGRGELEAFAGLRRAGTRADIVAVRAQTSASAEIDRRFERLCGDDPALFVVKLVGPSVHEFFASESGCQVLETLGGGHEIVRVRVLDGSAIDDPEQLIERTLAQREAFIAALESGTPLPTNPDAMLPIIRRFKLEEARAGRHASVEVEDYPLSHASTHAGTALAPVLALLWLMRVGVAIGRDRERRSQSGERPLPKPTHTELGDPGAEP